MDHKRREIIGKNRQEGDARGPGVPERPARRRGHSQLASLFDYFYDLFFAFSGSFSLLIVRMISEETAFWFVFPTGLLEVN